MKLKVSLLLGVLLAAGLLIGAKLRASEEEATPYAYWTERALIVVNEGHVVARVDRIFDPPDAGSEDAVTWTNSGRFVAVVSDATLRQEDAAATELIFVDVESGQERRVRCPNCSELLPVGDDSVLASTYEPAFTRFDLAAGGKPARVERQGLLGNALAAAAGRVLTSESNTDVNGYTQRLVVTREDGSEPQELGAFSSGNHYMPAAGKRSGAGAEFAVAFRPDPGECESAFPVSVFKPDGAGYRTEPTDTAPLEPAGFRTGTPGGFEVHDLWWDAHGVLNATATAWHCAPPVDNEASKQIDPLPSSVWRLVDGRWTRGGAGRATIARDLKESARVLLTIPDCIPMPEDDIVIVCNVGTLTEVRGSQRKQVATGVLGVSTPPVDG